MRAASGRRSPIPKGLFSGTLVGWLNKPTEKSSPPPPFCRPHIQRGAIWGIEIPISTHTHLFEPHFNLGAFRFTHPNQILLSKWFNRNHSTLPGGVCIWMTAMDLIGSDLEIGHTSIFGSFAWPTKAFQVILNWWFGHLTLWLGKWEPPPWPPNHQTKPPTGGHPPTAFAISKIISTVQQSSSWDPGASPFLFVLSFAQQGLSGNPEMVVSPLTTKGEAELWLTNQGTASTPINGLLLRPSCFAKQTFVD